MACRTVFLPPTSMSLLSDLYRFIFLGLGGPGGGRSIPTKAQKKEPKVDFTLPFRNNTPSGAL